MSVLACSTLAGGLAAVGALCLFASLAVAIPLIARFLLEERRARRAPMTPAERCFHVTTSQGERTVRL
jgi:hypothetical protein